MLGLCDLPPEVLQLLLTYAEPVDIITLRQCCTLLDALSRDRVLWMKLLQRLCSNLNIPLAYFCTWNLASDQLEIAACSYSRFKSTLIRNGVYTTTAVPNPPIVKPSIVSFLPASASTRNTKWLRLQLSPGGKLLCAVNDKEVQIFDLRGSRGSLFGLVARAVYEEPHGEGIVSIHFDQSPSSHREGSAILVLGSHSDPNHPSPAVISIFELRSLHKDRPSLISGKTLLHNAVSVAAVHSGRPILFDWCYPEDGGYPRGLGLWDFEANHAVRSTLAAVGVYSSH